MRLPFGKNSPYIFVLSFIKKLDFTILHPLKQKSWDHYYSLPSVFSPVIIGIGLKACIYTHFADYIKYKQAIEKAIAFTPQSFGSNANFLLPNE